MDEHGMPAGRGPLPRRTIMTGGLMGAAALALSACAPKEESLVQQSDQAGDKGYIAGDGSVTEYAEDQRSQPVEFSGTLFDGTEVTAQDLRGEPALLNFWYAGCAPCRKEAPDLAQMHADFGERVAFYGVNVRDEEPTARAFERSFSIDYPSFQDKGGEVLLGLAEYVPPQAVPTTIILDSKGRVASRVLGIAEPSILKSLLESVTDA